MLLRHGDGPGRTFVHARTAVDTLFVDHRLLILQGDRLRRATFHTLAATRALLDIYYCRHLRSFLLDLSTRYCQMPVQHLRASIEAAAPATLNPNRSSPPVLYHTAAPSHRVRSAPSLPYLPVELAVTAQNDESLRATEPILRGIISALTCHYQQPNHNHDCVISPSTTVGIDELTDGTNDSTLRLDGVCCSLSHPEPHRPLAQSGSPGQARVRPTGRQGQLIPTASSTGITMGRSWLRRTL